MKVTLGRLVASLIGLGWQASAIAQTATPNEIGPAPHDAWALDVGTVGRVRPEHLGASRYAVDVLPSIDFHLGDRLSLSLDDGARYAALKSKMWAAGPVVEYRQSFTDKLPTGARNVGDAVEVGGFVSGAFPVGQAEVRLRRALTGYEGWSGDVSFDTGGQVSKNWKIGLEARVAWADQNFTNDFFGLKYKVARKEGLPRFLHDDLWTAGLQAGAARQVGPHLQVVVAISDDHIIGAAPRTPLLQSRDVAVLAFGVTYHWGGQRK